MFHLTARVAWHDSCWDGRICKEPSRNCFCVALDRVREERQDDKEDASAGRPWSEYVTIGIATMQSGIGRIYESA